MIKQRWRPHCSCKINISKIYCDRLYGRLNDEDHVQSDLQAANATDCTHLGEAI